jgi:hypothetical protein
MEHEIENYRKTFLEPGQKGLGYEARAFARSRIENGGSRIAIFYSLSSILKHTIGHFSAGSLGNGIGSTGQAQEIPDDQEQNAGKLRKRRRDMEEPAA